MSHHFKNSFPSGNVIVTSVGLILSILNELELNTVIFPAKSIAVILITALSVLYQGGIVHTYNQSFSVPTDILDMSEKSHKIEYWICNGVAP
jgi:hypothetical protein